MEELIRKLHVLQVYNDVFPRELSGMPPTREFDFFTYLIRGAKPIAQTSYKILLLRCKNSRYICKIHYKKGTLNQTHLLGMH